MTRLAIAALIAAAVGGAIPAPSAAAVKCRPVTVRRGPFEGGASHIWATRTNCRVARAVVRHFVCRGHAPNGWSILFLEDYWTTGEMRSGRRVVRFRPSGGDRMCLA